MNHQGSLAIISNMSGTRFLIQRKDGNYPIEQQKRTICFFGGSVEGSESPLEGLVRELDEELGYEPLIRDLYEKLDSRRFSRKDYRLPSQKNPGTEYDLAVFRIKIYDYVLEDFERVMYEPGMVKEGYAEIVSKQYLQFVSEYHSNDIFSSLGVVVQDLFK